jgi:hypothetical protein
MLRDANRETPYQIAKFLNYEECMEIMRSNTGYWQLEESLATKSPSIGLLSLQDLTLRTINKQIAEKPQLHAVEFLKSESSVVEVYLRAVTNEFLK